jgi:hypothetical protein
MTHVNPSSPETGWIGVDRLGETHLNHLQAGKDRREQHLPSMSSPRAASAPGVCVERQGIKNEMSAACFMKTKLCLRHHPELSASVDIGIGIRT